MKTLLLLDFYNAPLLLFRDVDDDHNDRLSLTSQSTLCETIHLSNAFFIRFIFIRNEFLLFLKIFALQILQSSNNLIFSFQ